MATIHAQMLLARYSRTSFGQQLQPGLLQMCWCAKLLAEILARCCLRPEHLSAGAAARRELLRARRAGRAERDARAVAVAPQPGWRARVRGRGVRTSRSAALRQQARCRRAARRPRARTRLGGRAHHLTMSQNPNLGHLSGCGRALSHYSALGVIMWSQSRSVLSVSWASSSIRSGYK